MTRAASRLIKRIFALRSSITRTGTNHDIYDKRLTLRNRWSQFNKIPKCIYFYYIRFDTDGALRVGHYFYNDGPDPAKPRPNAKIPYTKVRGIIKHLALRVRDDNLTPLPGESNFENIKWNKRSYIAIYLDEKKWKFHKRRDNKVALAFVTGQGVTPNHTFFDASDIELDMPNRRTGRTDKRTAVFFVNHMKRDSDGDDLGREDQKFEFEMFFDVNFADPSAVPMTVIIDPGGTNQGPPPP